MTLVLLDPLCPALYYNYVMNNIFLAHRLLNTDIISEFNNRRYHTNPEGSI